MAKLTLSDLTSTQASSIVSTTNANNAAIEAALEKTLSRDGTSPNSMSASLDMNSNRIINLPLPVSGSEPVRKAEFDEEIDALDAAVLAAQQAQTAAENALDEFTDLWLGSFAVEPTLDNDGNGLQAGALYYDTVTGFIRIFHSGSWHNTVAPGLSDGDAGDIIVSSLASVLTIDNDVVTNAKLANVATATIKGRSTAGTGDPEDLTPTQAKAVLAITSADISDFTEAAQDAVGNILTDSSEIDFTYDDGAGTITAVLKAGSIDESKLDASVNASLDLADNSSQIGHTHLLAAGATDVTITAANLNTLDDGADTTLHFHASDRARANHTGSQALSTISDVTITATDLNTLDDGVNTTLHFHSSDRNRSNHTGSQLSSTISNFTEAAQDAVGGAFDSTLVYTDGSNAMGRASISGHISIPSGSNTASLSSFTMAQLDAAVSDGNVSYVGHGHAISDVTSLQATLDAKQIGIQFKDEGSNVGTSGAITSIDFVGTGVTASAIGNALTVTVSGGGGGGLSDGDYGDITISGGGGALTIDNDVVTFAKMQNVAANSVPARAANSSGDLSEVALGASKLLGRGSSGDIASISLGTSLDMSGTVLDAVAASETVPGVVELATTAEAETGTDTTRAVTPAGVAAAIAAAPASGAVFINSTGFSGNTTSTIAVGGIYTQLLVRLTQAGGTLACSISISDDGTTFGTAVNFVGAGVAMRLVNGHIKITNTGITGNKTIQPYMVVVDDTDATAATATLYNISGTETSETGVTHSVRLTTVNGITSWELWGIP